jgi:membrane-bound serine protease (ClpP class)
VHGKDTLVVNGDTIVKWIRDPRIAEAMVDERIIIEGLVDSTHVLTFTALEAIEHGFCDGLANSLSEVIEQLGIENPTTITFTPTLFDGLKGLLTSPILRGILILLIIGGLYFEMQSPGIGFPLVVSIIAAVLYFAPLYIDGLAEYWEIILFIVGIILIIIEIFVTPGFGILGILGILLAITGLTLSLLDNVSFDFSGVGASAFFTAMSTVILGIAGAFILSIWLSHRILVQKSGLFSRVALHTGQEIVEGYVGVDISMSNLVGRDAIAATVLRPSGKVSIDDELYDACAVEGFIEKNENVKVTDFCTGQLYVRKL